MRHTFRMTLCRIVGRQPGMETDEIIRALEDIYKGERQVRATPQHLQVLRAVGILQTSGEFIRHENGEDRLIQQWTLTPSGQQRLERILR